MSINEVLSFSLSARNLCQAKKIGDTLVTACSACYTNLRKTETYLADFPEIKSKVDTALAEAGLNYEGGIVTKHFLQTVVEDVGLDRIKSLVKQPLSGLRVAPYYGCQIARPYGIEDDADNPTMMDKLLDGNRRNSDLLSDEDGVLRRFADGNTQGRCASSLPQYASLRPAV